MKPGGASAKGGEFERKVCTDLSHWITDGQRGDIFERNVGSGGRFTMAVKREKLERGMPGDIMAANPRAFDFLSLFLVECKHLASLNLEAYLFDTKNSSMLSQIITLARKQASEAETPLHWMVIARQNFRDILMFVDLDLFDEMEGCTHLGMELPHHVYHYRTVVSLRFADFLRYVRPIVFIPRMLAKRSAP